MTTATKTPRTVHTMKEYAYGVAHIESHGSGYLVSFYGRRVTQATAATLAEARMVRAALAKAARS